MRSSDRTTVRLRGHAMLACLAAVLASIVSSDVNAQAGPAMMDPKRMSGIPRLDPAVAPGTITIRCLLGGFDRPAIGVNVRVELRDAQAQHTEVREVVTGDQGRAELSGLESFFDGQAVATVVLEGRALSSQPIPISREAGTRVMLVSGAAHGDVAAEQPASREGSHGGKELPTPGVPFALPNRPRGTLVVGTLDLEHGRPMTGLQVTLRIEPSHGDTIVRTARTDAMGRTVFENLVAPTIPARSKLRVEAPIEGTQSVSSSTWFELDQLDKQGVALVLTSGRAPAPTQAQEPSKTTTTLPSPRSSANVPAGSVRVHVLDAHDQPVVSHAVEVVKKDMAGTDMTYAAMTDAHGVAMVEHVDLAADAFYVVRMTYDGAPYRSELFELPDTMGAEVYQRVYAVSGDSSVVKAAVQFDLLARENDHVQVVQMAEAMVTGERAFWPAGGLRIAGADGSKGLVVMDRASEWLRAEDKAPFAELTGPIPPGEVVDVSVAYLIEHDGTALLRWTTPLSLMEVTVGVPEQLELIGGAVGAPESVPHQGKTAKLYRLGPRSAGTTIELAVSGLPTRPRVYRNIAAGVALTTVMAVASALALARRRRPYDRLIEQRDALLAALTAAAARGGPAAASQRTKIVRALDRIYRQLDALDPNIDTKAAS